VIFGSVDKPDKEHVNDASKEIKVVGGPTSNGVAPQFFVRPCPQKNCLTVESGRKTGGKKVKRHSKPKKGFFLVWGKKKT